MNSGPFGVQEAMVGTQERTIGGGVREVGERPSGCHCFPEERLSQLKRIYICAKTLKKVALLFCLELFLGWSFRWKYLITSFFFPCHSSWILLPPPFFWLIKLSSCLLLQLLPNSCYCWVLKQRKTLVTKICCILKYKTNKIEPNWPGWGVNYLNLQNQGLRFWIILSG